MNTMDTTFPKGLLSSGTLGQFTLPQCSPWLKLSLGQSCMIQKRIKIHLCITLTDSWKTGRMTLQCEIPRLWHLGMGGGYVLGGSLPRIPCLFSYVIFWLFTISDPLWMMMEKNLRLRLKWQMGCSREFCLSSNMRLLIAAIDTLYPSHVGSHRVQRRLKLWFVTLAWWTSQGTFVNDCIMPPRMLCDDRKPLGELDANSEVKILCSQEAPWSQDLGLTSLFYWESPSLCRHSVNR